MRKITALTICFLILCGCFANASTSGLSREFVKDSIEIVKMIDNRMHSGKQLSDEEELTFLLHMKKYENDPSEEEDLVLSFLELLEIDLYLIVTANNMKEREESIDGYIKRITALEELLDI